MLPTTRELLLRYFTNDCTEAESIAATTFIAENTDPALIEACLQEAYAMQPTSELLSLSEQEYDTAWQQFQVKATLAAPAIQKTRVHRMKWLAAAAAILALVTGLRLLYRTQPPPSVAAALADAQVIKGQLGTHKQVMLADGSTIYLFPGSELHVPVGYNQSNRIVQLKGRAFFDVAANAQKPFSVRTTALTTQVLGTSFEVNEAAGKQVMITVRTGLVAVTKGAAALTRLSANQQIRYTPANDSFAVANVNADRYCNWIAGELVFDNTPLPEVCKTLEQWYGITIQLQGAQWQQKAVSSQFKRQSLETVLHVLSVTTGFTYQVHGQQVIIH